MTTLRLLVAKFAGLFTSRRADRELVEEMDAHLASLTDDLVASGMSPADARLAARRAFGNTDRIRALYRDQLGLPAADAVMQDLRIAARGALAAPGFSLAASGALGIGLGVATLIFTILYGMNLRPLPFASPEQIVGLRVFDTRGRVLFPSVDLYEVWRNAIEGHATLSASKDASMTLSGGGVAAERYGGSFITANTFGMLGVSPMLGRDFRTDDERPGAAPVVILGHQVWRSRYGSDTQIVGRTVRVGGQAATVVGVMPPGFRFPFQSDVWQPLGHAANSDSATRVQVSVTGRLSAGTSLERAQAIVAAASQGAATDVAPAPRGQWRVTVRQLNDMYFGSSPGIPPAARRGGADRLADSVRQRGQPPGRTGPGARTRDLRAGRARSQPGAARLATARRGSRARRSRLRGRARPCGTGRRLVRPRTSATGLRTLPYWTHFSFDWRVYLFLGVIGTGAVLLASLAPILHVTGSRGRARHPSLVPTSATSSRQRAGNLLLTVQFALTLTMLGAATVLVRSAAALQSADRVVAFDHAWTGRIDLPPGRYPTAGDRERFLDRLRAALRGRREIEASTIASAYPFIGTEDRHVALGSEGAAPSEWPSAAQVGIDPHYFDTLGLPLEQGRNVTSHDAPSATIAIVNRTFVTRIARDAEVLGRTVRLSDPRRPGSPVEALTIVGIAPSIRQGPMSDAQPVVYRPFSSQASGQAILLLRSDGRDDAALSAARDVVAQLDPDLPLFDVVALEDISEFARWTHRIVSTILAAFAAVALLLAAIGLYAVASFSVSKEVRTIGIRRALGATGAHIAAATLGPASRYAALGACVGLGGAVAISSAMGSLLIGTRITDPSVLTAIVGLMGATVLLAMAVPLRRTLRIDPAEALRHD
ncbi:MAG: ABC transporter permease [Vicinamibacterales bacterium]